MPGAAAAVRTVFPYPGTVTSDLRDALQRNYSAGRSVAGAAYRAIDLGNLLNALLNEFAWDIDRGAQNLKLAIEDWANTEEENAAKAKALAAEIESGVTYNGRKGDELLDVPKAFDPGLLFLDLEGLMGPGKPTP